MRKILLAEAQPGMRLAKTIYHGDDGRILLSAESELKGYHIQRLREYNCEYVYVYDATTEAPSTDYYDEAALAPVKEETRAKAAALLRKTIQEVRAEGSFDSEKLEELIREITEYILSDARIVYDISSIYRHDNYTFTHSINVCVLSILIGSLLGHDRNELEILGIGAILHDLGKISVRAEILNKTSLLEPVEYDLIKNHTTEGYELVKKSVHISFLPAHIALQHHEREDGSGYPKGLTAKEIHQFAKIVAVADVFDAMTSNRPYKQEVPVYLAAQEILSEVNIKFNRAVVEAFIRVINPFPKGSTWLLDNGERVTVTSVSRTECLATVLNSHDGERVVNLYKLNGLLIVKNLD